jgi:hypothetical protein
MPAAFLRGVKMNYTQNYFGRFLFALVVLAAVGGNTFGQKTASSVKAGGNEPSALTAAAAPVEFAGSGAAGNPSCSTLNASSDVRFSHITTDNELKLDFSDPNGTYAFTSGSGRLVTGNQSPGDTVTITSGSSQIQSWSSSRFVTAVILKLGNRAYAYPYKPYSFGDTNLKPSDFYPQATLGLSHVTFCFGDLINPTSADVDISGRIVDADGNGIAKAQLILINGATGESKITTTSAFGYYTFTGVEVDQLYIMNVSHRRFAFDEKQRVVRPMDSMADVDFIALPIQ